MTVNTPEPFVVKVVRLVPRGHIVRVFGSGVTYLDPEESAELGQRLIQAADEAVNADRAERRS